MKISGNIFRWVFIVCLPVLLLTVSLAWAFNSRWFFNYGFNKYNIGAVTGLSDSNLNKIATGWTNYINSNQEYWDIVIEQDGNSFTLFTPEEQLHFKDVKELVLLDYKVLSTTLVMCFIYVFYHLWQKTGKRDRRLAVDAFIGSGISMFLILLLGVASLLDFNGLFLNMHYLLFTNDFWYAQGYMLNLFPEGFWYDAALLCIGGMVIMTLAVGAASLIFIKLNKSAFIDNLKAN